MALSQRLEIRQGQSLVMTPQLLQAIKLLQLSHLDLAAYVDAELERNPLLERVEEEGPPETLGPAHEDSPSAEPFEADGGDAGEADAPADNWLTEDRGASRAELEGEHDTSFENVFQDEVPDRAPPAGGDAVTLTASPWSNAGGGGFDGEAPDFEATLASEASLHDHLAAQLDLATVDPAERLIGRHLVDAVNEAGYLTETVDDIAERLGAEPATVERVLRLVQGFEPSGVAARDLAECLTIQLREQNRFDPAMAALVSRLDLVAKRDFPALKRLCGVDDEDLAEMLAEIRALDPKPGRAFAGSPVQILVPDVFVRPAPDGSWIVELNSGTLPRVLMNQSYYAKVSRTLSKDADKAFITECLQTANWLTRSLEQRAKTILKVASEIVRQQDGFFANGVAHLRPLNLKTIADAIGMHEFDGVAGDLEQGDRDEPRHLRDEVLLHRRDPGRRRRRGPFLRGGAAPHPAARRGRGHAHPVRRRPRPEAAPRGRRHRPPDRRQVPRIAADSVLDRAPPGEPVGPPDGKRRRHGLGKRRVLTHIARCRPGPGRPPRDRHAGEGSRAARNRGRAGGRDD